MGLCNHLQSDTGDVTSQPLSPVTIAGMLWVVATATPTPESRSRPPRTRRGSPGALELVRTFVNTVDVETGDDVLAAGDPKAVKAWFVEQDLLAGDARVTPADAKRVVEVREALRALLLANNGEPLADGAVEVLNDVAARSPLEAQFDADGDDHRDRSRRGRRRRARPAARDRGAGGADGTWSRLKACKATTASGRSTTSPATARASGASWPSAATAARPAPTGTASATTDRRQRAGAPPHMVRRMTRR